MTTTRAAMGAPLGGTGALILAIPTDTLSAVGFVRWATKFLGGGFHADTLAPDYVEFDGGSGRTLFTPAECSRFTYAVNAAYYILDDIHAASIDIGAAYAAAHGGDAPNGLLEAECLKCGETFNPASLFDIVHGECNGQGSITGSFSWDDESGPACSPGCRQGDHDADCAWYDWRYPSA